jgi:hypothetical protein
VTYGAERLYAEATYVAYHLGWPRDEILGMPHAERARWVDEIAAINTRLNES